MPLESSLPQQQLLHPSSSQCLSTLLSMPDHYAQSLCVFSLPLRQAKGTNHLPAVEYNSKSSTVLKYGDALSQCITVEFVKDLVSKYCSWTFCLSSTSLQPNAAQMASMKVDTAKKFHPMICFLHQVMAVLWSRGVTSSVKAGTAVHSIWNKGKSKAKSLNYPE